MRLWNLMHMQKGKALMSLCKHMVLSEPLLLAHMNIDNGLGHYFAFQVIFKYFYHMTSHLRVI